MVWDFPLTLLNNLTNESDILAVLLVIIALISSNVKRSNRSVSSQGLGILVDSATYNEMNSFMDSADGENLWIKFNVKSTIPSYSSASLFATVI